MFEKITNTLGLLSSLNKNRTFDEHKKPPPQQFGPILYANDGTSVPCDAQEFVMTSFIISTIVVLFLQTIAQSFLN